MSFALPPVKTKPIQCESWDIKEGTYGVPDLMTYGLSAARSNIEVSHPLELSELNYNKNQENLNMTMLRNIQGLHAPLKLAMELKSLNKVGHLPFIQRSNAGYESLTGSDIEIGPSDIYNIPEFQENIGLPHAIMEKTLGLL